MGMTMTQKILAAHAGLPEVKAGQLIRAKLDMLLGNDITSPVAIRELMDKGLCKAPVNQHYGPGGYETAIDRSIQLYQPEYWAYRERKLHLLERNQLSIFHREPER